MNRTKPAGNTPTVVDVAKHAQVSVATAARILSNSSYRVSQELAERVMAAATELGYVPNLAARNLRTGARTSIGVIMGSMISPYFGEIAEVITEEASMSGWVALISNAQRDPSLEIELCRRLWAQRVGGLVLAWGGVDLRTEDTTLPELLKRMQEAGISIASLAPRSFEVPTFSVDNEAVGVLIGQELVQASHRDVGLIFGTLNSVATDLRVRGLTRILAAAGGQCRVFKADYSSDEAAAATEALLRMNPRLTAFVADGDAVAAGVTRVLRLQDRSVPDDISLITIGDSHFARGLSPQLSTVDLQLVDSGRAAVRYLMSGSLTNPGQEGMSFQPRLIDRGSIRRLA